MISTHDRFFPSDPVLEVLGTYDNYYRLKNIYILDEEDFYEIKKGPKLHVCQECKYKYDHFKAEGKTVFVDPDTEEKTEYDWSACTNCRKSYDIQTKQALSKQNLTDKEIEEFTIENDPVKWLEANFNCQFRFYQHRLLQCSAKWQIWKMGRRSGKSHAMAGKMLYGAFVRSTRAFEDDPNLTEYKIMVVTAARPQILSILDEMMGMIKRRPDLQELCTAVLKNSPYGFTITHPTIPNRRIIIKGFCAGDTGATGVRGQGAHEVYLDEADYIQEMVITSVLTPIMTESPNTIVTMASTISGQHGKFWEYATTPTSGWVTHSYRSLERPADCFNYRMYQTVRSNIDRHSWSLEYECVWSEAIDAVFDAGDIARSLRTYPLPVDPKKLYPDEQTIIGIDWNGSNIGNHIVVVGYSESNQTYRLLDKLIFYGNNLYESSLYSRQTRKAIVELALKYKVSSIYCDKGAGTTDIEELITYCKTKEIIGDFPDTYKEARKIKILGIPMQGNIKWKAPDSKTYIDKNALNLLVNNLSTQLEQGRIILPKDEEYKKATGMGLVSQMRSLKINRIVSGKTSYVEMYDHTLVAYYLAIGGHCLKIRTTVDNEGIEIFITDTIYTSTEPVDAYMDAFNDKTPIDVVKRLIDENNGILQPSRRNSRKRSIITSGNFGLIGHRRKQFERILNEGPDKGW